MALPASTKNMIPQRIQALFDFIDYLDSYKQEYIEKYVPLCSEIKNLVDQRNGLNPDANYKDKQLYDKIQAQLEEKFSPITTNIYDPISNKLKELKIWSGDQVYASVWNINYPAITEFKENFTSDDVAQVIKYKQKYVSFRKETDPDFFCLTFAFRSLDEILKQLFDFFKDTDENEFEEFEAKTIKVSSVEEVVAGLKENSSRNVKFSIPFESLGHKLVEQKVQHNSTNINNEIIMGDKYQVGDISDNSGQIAIGKGNKNKNSGGDEVAKESFQWQKWGVIIGVILSIVAIAVAIIIG